MSQHVLVPVDGSSQSETALEHVLNEMPEARITLLHVIDPISSFGYGDDDYFDVDAFQAEAKRQHDRGEELLEEHRNTATARGVEVDTILTTGKPARRILETVETDDIDHIVMGSRGRSGIGRVLFGSVAESVTRRASVPVTITR